MWSGGLRFQTIVHRHVGRRLKPRDESETSDVEQRHSSPDGSLGQQLVLEGHAHVLSVQGKAESAKVHVQQDSKNTLFLEELSVGLSHRVVRVTQLAQAIIGKSKFVVGKTGVYVEGLLGCDSDLQLVLRPGVRNNLPIVNSAEEWPV